MSDTSPHSAEDPPPVERPFADRVLMCAKCARKLGPGGKAIRKSLKRALESGRWGKARLVKTGCFSLCPKRGQVLAAFRRPGDRRLVVVAPGFELAHAIDYLLQPRGKHGIGWDDGEP
jgi:hypothetical protein